MSFSTKQRFVLVVFVLVAACLYAAYDGSKPADNEFVADVPGCVRANDEALKNDEIVNAGALQGRTVGSQAGNIPLNNGEFNTSLNADQLDSYHASDFIASSSYSASDVLNKVKTVDGTGSALDADLLDGYHSSSFDSAGAASARFGAATTGGVADWNDVSNTVPGAGYTLLLGSATNGPGPAVFFHAMNIEYSSKNGTGNLTQFAIPYTVGTAMYLRSRYSGAWGSWFKMWDSSTDGTGSGMDADALDGYHVSTTPNAVNTVPVRDASGYLRLGWINTTSGDNGTTTPTRIYASNDGYIRYYSVANFVSVCSLVTLTGTQSLTNKTLSTGCTWNGNAISDAYIPATIARDSELTTHTGSTAAHGATGAVVGTTNTQTLSNKTYDVVTSSGYVTCTSGTTTNLVSLGVNQQNNYSIQWSWYTSTSLIYQGIAPGPSYYCYYDASTGYVKFSNSSGSTLYVRAVCIPIL